MIYFYKLKNVWTRVPTPIFSLPLATVFCMRSNFRRCLVSVFFFLCRVVFTTRSRVFPLRRRVNIIIVIVVNILRVRRAPWKEERALYVIMHIIVIRAYSRRALVFFNWPNVTSSTFRTQVVRAVVVCCYFHRVGTTTAVGWFLFFYFVLFFRYV